jgi:hypothetical protein
MPKWSANPNVVMRDEDDGMHLAFDVAAGSGLILNPVSHFIWTRALDALPPEDIAESMRRQFDFPQGPPAEPELLTIVTTHLALLEHTHLLVAEPAPIDAGTDARGGAA